MKEARQMFRDWPREATANHQYYRKQPVDEWVEKLHDRIWRYVNGELVCPFCGRTSSGYGRDFDEKTLRAHIINAHREKQPGWNKRGELRA